MTKEIGVITVLILLTLALLGAWQFVERSSVLETQSFSDRPLERIDPRLTF